MSLKVKIQRGSHFTNRAPYPILHLLGDDVSKPLIAIQIPTTSLMQHRKTPILRKREGQRTVAMLVCNGLRSYRKGYGHHDGRGERA